MRARVDKHTVKIDIDDDDDLARVRERIAEAFDGKGTEARATRVALNGVDDLGRGRMENERATLKELGVSDGDLLICTLDRGDRGDRSDRSDRGEANANANANANARATDVEARARNSNDSAREIPSIVRDAANRGASKSEIAFVAAHAFMLASGARLVGRLDLSDGFARRGCFSARYVLYDQVSCAMRAQPVEGNLSMIASVEADASAAYATVVDVETGVRASDSITAEEVRRIWAKVNDGFVKKLFAAAKAHAAGVLERGNLMSLPPDIKRAIVSRMDAYGLAYCACACKELRELCSRDEFWAPLLRRDFGVEQSELNSPLRSAYNRLAIERSAQREAQLRAESYHPMPGRLPRYGEYVDPQRDIYPGHLPGHVPGIIGGDYDLWPGGLNPNPPGYGRGGFGPGHAPDPRGGWPGGGPPFPPQPGGLPYRPDPDADLRNPINPLGGRGRGRGDPRFPSMPPNPGYDGRPRPPPDFF